MQEEHLAIASVPVQKWGPVFEDCEALKIGTIFQDLNKPFYAAPLEAETEKIKAEPKSEEQRKREELMEKIMQTSFVLDDLVLYLDLHETDEQAMQMFLQKTQERDALKREFAKLFYPLTRDCIPDTEETGKFRWQDGVIPWEGACK